MSSEVSVEEIQRDIESLRQSILHCSQNKHTILASIEVEKNEIVNLRFYANEEKRRDPTSRPKYDMESLNEEATRREGFIEMFNQTIVNEDASIARFEHMIAVLTEDLVRPKEIFFDAKTGQVITK